MFIWVLYALGVLMTWFENRFKVCNLLGRPLWFHHSNQVVFSLFRILVLAGAIAGIWYLYGFLIAFLSLMASFLFAKLTFHSYFSREVGRLAEKMYANMKEKPSGSDGHLDEAALVRRSLEYSTAAIWGNVKGDSSWYWTHGREK
jgi:hypothetical protein